MTEMFAAGKNPFQIPQRINWLNYGAHAWTPQQHLFSTLVANLASAQAAPATPAPGVTTQSFGRSADRFGISPQALREQAMPHQRAAELEGSDSHLEQTRRWLEGMNQTTSPMSERENTLFGSPTGYGNTSAEDWLRTYG